MISFFLSIYIHLAVAVEILQNLSSRIYRQTALGLNPSFVTLGKTLNFSMLFSSLWYGNDNYSTQVMEMLWVSVSAPT